MYAADAQDLALLLAFDAAGPGRNPPGTAERQAVRLLALLG
ncbi:hypothetical protein [Actinacidiphila bryophytorum]|nr:hypothetical protein [Actinacidiphila bryophytorum]